MSEDRHATLRYAAYGSNLHPTRLRARVPSARLRGTAALEGYALRFHKRSRDGSAKCDLVAADEVAHVAIYELDADHKTWLDAIEGVGAGYEIATLDVPGHGTCFAYVASASHIEPMLEPFVWYRALVEIGCRYHGFPRAYLERVAATAAIDDPDAARHEQHMSIVRQARQRIDDPAASFAKTS